MQPVDGAPVIGKDGFRGRLDLTGHEGQRVRDVVVQLEDGRWISVPVSMLEPREDGSYYLPFSMAEFEAAAGQPTPLRVRPRSAGAEQTATEQLVIPLVEERLRIDRQRVDTGGVRVSTVVHEREETVDEPLYKEEVEVQRVPINRVIEGPLPIRYEGDTTIVPLIEEVLVVEKRLMLKEEIHIRKRQFTAREPQTVVLRSEDARIERIEPSVGRGGTAGQDGPAEAPVEQSDRPARRSA